MDSPNVFALKYEEFILLKNQYYVARLAFTMDFKYKK